MKALLRNICILATGINLPIIGLSVYLGDLNLFLLSAASATLTLTGALFVYSEDDEDEL